MSLRFSHLYTRGAFWGSGEVWWASHLLSQSVGVEWFSGGRVLLVSHSSRPLEWGAGPLAPRTRPGWPPASPTRPA